VKYAFTFLETGTMAARAHRSREDDGGYPCVEAERLMAAKLGGNRMVAQEYRARR
jgi:hypothetical protein